MSQIATVLDARRPRLGGRFHLLWAGQTASLLGDQITVVALPLLVVGTFHADTLEVGLLSACLRLPFLIVGLAAGVWVTRGGVLRSMAASDVIRGIALLVVCALASVRIGSMWPVYALAVIVGAATVFFQIGYQSVVPELVPAGRWQGANTRLSVVEASALVVGPALGGVTVGLVGAADALVVDAGSYAVSVAALLTIIWWTRRRTRACGRPAAASLVDPSTHEPLFRSIAEAIAYVRSNRMLNTIMWVGALYNLGSAMYDALLVVFAVQTLGLSPAVFGFAVGVGTAGFPLGSLLSSVLGRRVGLSRALAWAGIPSVAGILVGALAQGAGAVSLLAAGAFLVGLGQGCFAVNAITLRQQAATARMRVRATAVHRFLSWGAVAIGAALAGVIGQTLGIRFTMFAAAVIAATSLIPLVRMARVPDAPADGTLA